MPKREKKTIPKKTQNNSQTERQNNENGPVPKKKCSKPNPEDSITKSKKLTEKLKNTRPAARKSRRTSTGHDEARICGNGKPMPSLADLEKMFEDSDDEEHKNTIGTPKKSQSSAILPQVTPEKPIVIPDDKLTSPGTIKKLADKMMNLISNLPDPILIDDVPRPPIIPPKKRKKPEVPYIVGCKDRPQVPHKPSVSFCKGDDYGIEKNEGNEDDEFPKKRAKRTKAVNLSKSIFNAKSDEIAAWLKDIDKAEQSDGSSDSNKTVEYEFDGKPRSFSPLPSTSKDNETISQNDKKFVESLIISESTSDDSLHSLCTIENNTSAIIVIDDEVIINDCNKTKLNTNDCVEIIDINDEKDNIKSARNCGSSEILIDEEYDDCYKFVYTDVSGADIPEIIDVDAVIAENKAIIEKYSKVEKLNSVTQVDFSNITALNNNVSVNCKTELDSTENLGNVLIDSNTKEGICPLNSTANQIERIVKSFFQNSSVENKFNFNNPSYMGLKALKSRFENNHYDLFTNFATWIKSFDTTETKSRVQNTVSHKHPVIDDVIEIDDNYFPVANISNHTKPRNRRKNRLPKNLPHNQSISHNYIQNSDCLWNSDPVNKEGNRSLNQIIPGAEFVVSNRTTTNRTNVQNRVPEQLVTYTALFQPPPVQPPLVHPLPVQPPAMHLPPVEPPPVQNSPVKKSIGDCPICMDNLSNNLVASTTCGHIFCMACIKAAVKANGKRCPTCRKVLKGMGFHQLFL